MIDPTTWRWDFSPAILVAAICALVLAAVLGSLNWIRNGKSRVVGFLEILRFIAISLLVVTLLRPEREKKISRDEEPVVLALLDESGSMATPDVKEDGTVYKRSDWVSLKTNDEAPFWKPLKASAKAELRPFSSPRGEGATDLAAPLIDALERFPNLKAVIALTDGD
ncbi:MAG: vWA domain-containing protein, partial [Opitutales bacterium]